MINTQYCPSCGRSLTLIYGDTEVTFYECDPCRVGVVHQGTRAVLISLGCSKHQFVENGVLRDASTIHEIMAGNQKLWCYRCGQYIMIRRSEVNE